MRDVYQWIERAMMVMVGIILVAFAANLAALNLIFRKLLVA